MIVLLGRGGTEDYRIPGNDQVIPGNTDAEVSPSRARSSCHINSMFSGSDPIRRVDSVRH